MINITNVNNAKDKMTEHVRTLSEYLENSISDGMFEGIPDMLRQYSDMIERDINAYKIFLQAYKIQELEDKR